MKLALLCLLMSLMACSELQPYIGKGNAPVETRGYGIDYWLTELQRTRGMSTEALRQTVNNWEQEFRDAPNDGNRIKLALLLTVGETSIQDYRRAQVLLDGLEKPPAEAAERELVAILRQIIDDQTRTSTLIEKLDRQVSQQSERIKQLEEQQQALTDIEQNIQKRDNRPVVEQENRQPDDESSSENVE